MENTNYYFCLENVYISLYTTIYYIDKSYTSFIILGGGLRLLCFWNSHTNLKHQSELIDKTKGL